MKKYTFAIFILCCLMACQSDREQQSLSTDIHALQQEIGEENQPSPEKLAQFKTVLEKYAANYPDDSLSMKYLSQAGEVARLMQQFDEAIRIYDRMISRYSGHPEAGKAMFMKGFTYENDLKNLDSARVVYTLFLEKYPKDDFADDAQFLLNNLGKKPEEVLKELGN
jgi:outer membrane protein assembly factor BamD (BamD/ComL family)